MQEPFQMLRQIFCCAFVAKVSSNTIHDKTQNWIIGTNRLFSTSVAAVLFHRYQNTLIIRMHKPFPNDQCCGKSGSYLRVGSPDRALH